MSPAPLRVCFLLSRYPPDFSGQGIQVQRMLPHLEAEGIEATVVTAESGVSAPASGDSQRVERILPQGRSGRDLLRRLLRLGRWLRTRGGDFDVVHAILLDWGLVLNLGWLSRHGVGIVYEMILLGSDDPVSIAHYRAGGVKLRRLRRHVDLWVGLSQAFLPTLCEAGVPEERFRVLYGGVDVDRFRPRTPQQRGTLRERLGLPAGARIALSVGAFVQRKGFDRVLAAWRASRPEAGRDLLLLVGPSTLAEGLPARHLAHAEEIRRLVSQGDLAASVQLVGRVDNLDEWMGACDLFVFLSRREGLGFVILEALATGLPCVVSPLDGIARELIDDGETGFVVDEADDPAAVAKRIRQLLPASPEREAMAAAARRHALDRFSMRARARRLAALYREIGRGPAA